MRLSPRRARRIVAQHVAASNLMDSTEDQWAGYGDMGEFDWEKVAALAEAMVKFPKPELRERAYAVLADRAENALDENGYEA